LPAEERVAISGKCEYLNAFVGSLDFLFTRGKIGKIYLVFCRSVPPAVHHEDYVSASQVDSCTTGMERA
jgi:hypothetical protein